MAQPQESTAPAQLRQAPLVGRSADIAALHAWLDDAVVGRGGTVVLIGEAGVGKTRLGEAVGEEAARRGFRIASGRAFQVESGVPYALFADAFTPVVRELEPAALSTMVRGGLDELAYVLPAIGGAGRGREPDDPAELKTRVLWTVAELVRGLAAKRPLLLLLDDVHWADLSSLELLHFLARHTTESKALIVCTYNETERGRRPELRTVEKSLLALGVARLHRVTPLNLTETDEVVRRTFGIDEVVSRDFSALLYGWTRGNAFFLTETLQSLVESGRLRRRADGQWLGWELAELELPPTVREVVVARLERLSDEARTVADVAAVIGTRFDHELLCATVELAEPELLAGLDELRRLHIVRELEDAGTIRYDFVHPMLRQSLYAELGAARARALHARIGAALERRFGEHAAAHADELAIHFAKAGGGESAPKAVQYLLAAGRSALARYADREAVEYLRLALERWRPDAGLPPREAVLNELARAHQRVGDHDAAIALWSECLAAASHASEPEAEAVLHRRLGQALYWSGRHALALEHFTAGRRLAEAAGRDADEARLRLAEGVSLQELGRAEEAEHAIQRALAIAEQIGEAALLARVHRALLLLHIWVGPPDAARRHGARAAELAREAGDAGTEFYSEWGLAVLEGLTGHTDAMARHIAAAERLAERRRSPLYWLWTAELSIELASAVGDWDRALAIGERAIALARSLNQRTLWPRLLVWTSLIHLGRGDLERAKAYVDEAWSVAGADAEDGPIDVHTVVPAHIGVAAYHLTQRDFREAIRVCEAGLAIADRTGYTFWAMHRLLPIMAEAYCHLRDVEGAAATEARIRQEAERLGHKVGLAWADTCRALVCWLQGDLVRAAKLIREACASLEAIPVIPDAARLRRQLAGRLAEIGDRDGALTELRRVHEIFARLGAEDELVKARGMFREVGAKPPARSSVGGAEGLTGRELEIARMVADRRSNKAIGKALDISPRTVSTHLSNIFRKLEVSSRGELADYVKEHGL